VGNNGADLTDTVGGQSVVGKSTRVSAISGMSSGERTEALKELTGLADVRVDAAGQVDTHWGTRLRLSRVDSVANTVIVEVRGVGIDAIVSEAEQPCWCDAGDGAGAARSADTVCASTANLAASGVEDQIVVTESIRAIDAAVSVEVSVHDNSPSRLLDLTEEAVCQSNVVCTVDWARGRDRTGLQW